MQGMLPLVKGQCRNVLKGHLGPVFVVRFDARGEYCMSAGQDRKVYLWNPKRSDEGALVQTYSGHSWEVFDLAIAHDARVFVSCGGDRQAFLWDTSEGRIVRKFQGHYLKLNAVAFNSDASVLASGSDDKTVRLWDCRSSSRFPIQIIEDAKDSISAIDMEGTRVGVGSLDGNVRIYDIRKASMSVDCFGVAAVTSLSLGMDEQCYLVSTADSSVHLMDGPSGMELNVFTGHCQETYRTESVFSSDEAYVFSGSEDSTIFAWDIVSAEVSLQLVGHSGAVTSLSHHPKEAQLLSASTDGTIRLWS